MLRHNQETNDKPQTLRVGSLVVRSLGQLLPHQLQSFHTRDAVYPVSGSCVVACVSAVVFCPFTSAFVEVSRISPNKLNLILAT